MPKITPSLLGAALLLTSAGISTAELPGAGKPVHFRLSLLHSNDADSQLLDSTATPGFGGAAHFVQLVRDVRADDKTDGIPSLLVSGGNTIFINQQFQVSLDSGAPFLDSKVISAARYDAVCLANHDFAFGDAVAANFIRGTTPRRTPFVTATINVSKSAKLSPLERQGRIASSTIIQKQGVKIGVIGSTISLQGFTAISGDIRVRAELNGEIQREVNRLRQRGAKIVVLLSNLPDIENQKFLIEGLSGIDIVVASGSTEVLANPDDLLVPGDEAIGKYPLKVKDQLDREVLLVTTGGGYRYLGRLVVGFAADGEIVNIDDSRTGPLRVAHPNERGGVGEASDVAAQVIEPLKDGLEQMKQNTVARVEGSLDGLQTHIRSRETNLGDLVADALLKIGRDSARANDTYRPDIAVINAGAIENNSIIRGSITESDVFRILPFPDFVTIVIDVTPAELKEVLENGVSNIKEGHRGRFPQVSGLRYTFNAQGRAQRIDNRGRIVEAGNRIREVQLQDGRYLVRNGEVVADGPSLNVATVDYLAFGGDQYLFYRDGSQSLGITYQDAFMKWLRKLGTVRQSEYPGTGRITRLN